MICRISKATETSIALIQSIPPKDGVPWTRDLLLQQAELKQSNQLSTKECEHTFGHYCLQSSQYLYLANATQINHNVKLLLDAVRNATGMTKALNEVTGDLMQYDYAQTLLGTEEVQGL